MPNCISSSVKSIVFTGNNILDAAGKAGVKGLNGFGDIAEGLGDITKTFANIYKQGSADEIRLNHVESKMEEIKHLQTLKVQFPSMAEKIEKKIEGILDELFNLEQKVEQQQNQEKEEAKTE